MNFETSALIFVTKLLGSPAWFICPSADKKWFCILKQAIGPRPTNFQLITVSSLTLDWKPSITHNKQINTRQEPVLIWRTDHAGDRRTTATDRTVPFVKLILARLGHTELCNWADLAQSHQQPLASVPIHLPAYITKSCCLLNVWFRLSASILYPIRPSSQQPVDLRRSTVKPLLARSIQTLGIQQ